jgi:hypothetical protein
MRPAVSSMAAICLAASLAHGSKLPNQTVQENKTKHPANQQSSSEATSQEEMNFKLLIMSNGVTKSGASFGGKIYETPAHTKVYLYMVHLGSREGAKKEYEDRLKEAIRITNQGEVQDNAATKPATMKDRAEIVVPATRDCKETTTILATAGTVLRVIQSCSPEAAIEFEKQAKRNGSENDQYVIR